jgi:hypothetical protein
MWSAAAAGVPAQAGTRKEKEPPAQEALSSHRRRAMAGSRGVKHVSWGVIHHVAQTSQPHQQYPPTDPNRKSADRWPRRQRKAGAAPKGALATSPKPPGRIFRRRPPCRPKPTSLVRVMTRRGTPVNRYGTIRAGVRGLTPDGHWRRKTATINKIWRRCASWPSPIRLRDGRRRSESGTHAFGRRMDEARRICLRNQAPLTDSACAA